MGDEKERTLWVGNLSEKVTEDILYELFLQAGPLNKVTIAKDKDGRSKRYAFIDFKHECSVPYTMQLMDGVDLFGQPLKLQTRTGSSQSQSPAHSGSTYPYTSSQMNTSSGHLKSPSFHRSNTWHGKDLADTPHRQRGYVDNQYNKSPSASHGHMGPPQGTWFADNRSPDSIDTQRQHGSYSQNAMVDSQRQQSYRHQPYAQQQYSRRRY